MIVRSNFSPSLLSLLYRICEALFSVVFNLAKSKGTELLDLDNKDNEKKLDPIKPRPKRALKYGNSER